jgi:chromosomal replication initiator protein DnaA
MNIIIEKWEQILNSLKELFELADISFQTWIAPLSVHHIEKNVVYVLIPSEKQMGFDFIERKYTVPLQSAISVVTGADYIVKFLLPVEQKEVKKTITPPDLNIMAEKANLNPKYTFDTFVVGGNNNFAHAASLAVAESPGEMYNPLFIYGDVGLGKTHLMHSIAHMIIERCPTTKVLYVTSEYFTNELIEAIRNGNNTAMSKFREKYRNIDVLLIDDIQFIIGKESTQEEFFHTFNDLYGAKKQIIISSDKPPKEMETLEERYSSRFGWGLLADISLPNYETRMAILKKKDEFDGFDIDDEVVQYIATNIKSNIRELEGAFNKIIAYANLEKREINLELAERALKDMIYPDANREITPQLIIDMVAEHFNISSSDIIGKNRNSEIVYPRQIAMYLCRNLISTPLKTIGVLLGKRDHSTVIHGSDKITKEMETSESTRNTIDIIKKKINPN